MNKQKKFIFRIIGFLIVFIVIFSGLNNLFGSNWNAASNEFYKEPDNTIEVVFLGSSMTEFGINPMKMYEEYGICSYNLGNMGQPVLASYYWLEEAYRLHADTLKTVIFDVSMLRNKSDISFYRRSLDNMKFSNVKYNAVSAYAKDFNSTVSYLVPLFSYHTKWKELNIDNFMDKESGLGSWFRGYYLYTTNLLESVDIEEINEPNYVFDENAQPMDLEEEGRDYLKKMVEFCEKNSLELVLIKTPNPKDWSSSSHISVDLLAKEYNLEFLDFNFQPLTEEISYNHIMDSIDGIHLNYYGANKFATWIGNYLIENEYASNIKENPKYAFMKQQLEEYKKEIEGVVLLRECDSLREYLSIAISNTDYITFVMINEESMIEEEKTMLEELGIKGANSKLSLDKYLAIIKNDIIIHELDNKYDFEEIKYQGELSDKKLFAITIDEDNMSCIIEGEECAIGTRGINIVVYDTKNHEVVDSVVFDSDLK